MSKPLKLQEAEAQSEAIRARMAGATPSQPAPELPAATVTPVPPTPAVAVLPSPAPAPVPTDVAELTRRFEARIESMNGRVRKAEADRKLAVEKTEALDRQVADLTKRVSDVQAAAPDDLTQHFTAEQIASIGEESLRLTLSTARKTSEKVLQSQLASAIAPLQQQLEDQAKEHQNERDKEREKAYAGFITALNTRVPDFRVIDTDPRFILWLDVVDVKTGYKRLQILHDAEANLNVDVAAGLFADFLKEQGTTSVPSTPAGQQVPLGQAPAGGSNAPAPAQPVTKAEITRFQLEYAQGKYRTRQAEAAAFQKRIDAAITAGMIR